MIDATPTTDPSHAWLRAALLVGVVYLLVGRVFARPTDHVRLWRLAAWLVSGVVYAAHVGYEHFRLHDAPRRTASHAALAVALGAFGLALAGMIRSMATGAAIRPAWFLALVLWPAVTAIPGFVVAFLVATVLARVPRSATVE